ncbi:hypothetical protein [uncultured Jannaschia sp.]|uniref:hypothetical protein n=1 Tax=uncultured Jannaschia sp. TaxID=293347 RepID=UPI00262589B4|nr:hypothetical protein [uncultured Jannaschia sp.]
MIDLARILVAPLLWLATFSAVYGLQGLGCAAGWDATADGPSPLRLLLVAAWGLTILMQVALLGALRSDRFGADRPLVRRVSVLGGWVGLVAAFWSLLPVATTTPCAA